MEIVIGILVSFLSFLILYFLVKGAVRNGVKEALVELRTELALRNAIKAGVTEALTDLRTEEKKEGAAP